MTSKNVPFVLVIIGVGILAGSLLADVIGIGNDQGFGKHQILGTVVGVAVMFLGLALTKKKA
jgi:hypothetical protein